MWRQLVGLALVGAALLTAAVDRPREQRQRFRAPAREPEVPDVPYDGRFTFARLKFTTGPGGYYFRGLPAWAHGYPRSETNLDKILASLTDIDVRTDASKVVAIDDPDLFKYPVVYATEPGFMALNQQEALDLRAYLQKGGFIIFDDFRGVRDWDAFERDMRQVLPDERLIELDATNPIFHSFFDIVSLDFVQFYDRGRPGFYGMYAHDDPTRRLQVIANFNNDVSEYWEYSDTGYTPIALSNEAYKLGVNYVVYGMTH